MDFHFFYEAEVFDSDQNGQKYTIITVGFNNNKLLNTLQLREKIRRFRIQDWLLNCDEQDICITHSFIRFSTAFV